MSRLPLAQVTLCAVDTQLSALAAQALLRSMQQCDFGRVLLFTHDWLPAVVLPGLEVIEIEPLRSSAEYSHFVMRQLPAYVRSSHALLIKWNGFVAHAEAWTDEFLAYDYLGAVWPDQPEALSVGNGGFSLRSRRFMQASMDTRISHEDPEDVVLCRDQRAFLEQIHGVHIAPARLARRFAHDSESPRGLTFGFHGAYNLPGVLDEPTLQDWLLRLPDDFFLSDEAHRLARALLRRGMPAAAQQLLQRRQAKGPSQPGTRILSAAASLMGLISPRVG